MTSTTSAKENRAQLNGLADDDDDDDGEEARRSDGDEDDDEDENAGPSDGDGGDGEDAEEEDAGENEEDAEDEDREEADASDKQVSSPKRTGRRGRGARVDERVLRSMGKHMARYIEEWDDLTHGQRWTDYAMKPKVRP